MILDTLRHCRLFDLLSEEELQGFVDLVAEHHFHKGEYICKEGAWGDSMFIIDSGDVKVSKKLDVEETWELTVLRHGDFFGEVALIDGSPRTATVAALSNTSVLEVYGRDFRNLIAQGNELSFKLYESLTRVLISRMRNTDALVTKIMTELKPGRAKEMATMRDAMTRMVIGR